MRFNWSECSAAVLFNTVLRLYFHPFSNTILQAMFKMYLQYIPNDRNILWRSFDSFSVYNIMLPYSWSTDAKSYFISKVVLALTLLIKSIFYILAITSNLSQRETTMALKVWFMALFYCRTLSNACRILLFNLLHGWFIYDLEN